MKERWVRGVWLGKRFTIDEHIIGLENGKVVRTRNVRPKSSEDTWSFEEIDRIKGQPWDPSVTLTYEKLAQEKCPRIEEPTPAEKEYAYMPRSHMITKADLTKAGGWTPGCRKCKAMKEGDHSRTNLAHSADCRARVAEHFCRHRIPNKDEESSGTKGRSTSHHGAPKCKLEALRRLGVLPWV